MKRGAPKKGRGWHFTQPKLGLVRKMRHFPQAKLGWFEKGRSPVVAARRHPPLPATPLQQVEEAKRLKSRILHDTKYARD